MSAFGPFGKHLLQDYFTGKTVKALLVDSTFVQDVDSQFLSDLGAGEISGGSYVAGGVTVTSLTFTYDATTNTGHVFSHDVEFPELDTADVAGIVFYIATGTPSTSVLLGYDAFASPVDSTDFPLIYQVDTVDGLFVVSLPE